MTLTESQVKWLRELAEEEFLDYDELFGESPDDAYEAGVRDGKIELAREILSAQ